MEIIFTVLLMYILFIYILFFSGLALLNQIKESNNTMTIVDNIWEMNLIDKMKVGFDTFIILFYLLSFLLYFYSPSLRPLFFGFIGFLFFWQFVLMNKKFYTENKFDLFWQAGILVILPLFIIFFSVMENFFKIKLPDYTSTFLSSVVSLSLVKDLCKNIFNLKYK